MHIFGVISIILFAVCFVPQIVKIIRTKEVQGISVIMWWAVVIAHLTGLFYVVSLRGVILIISYGTGLVLSLSTLGLVIFYGKVTNSSTAKM